MVTLNSRLGSLGFLALDGITDSTNNNYGFRDQILALQWVQTNIGSLGGDAANVALWGESAGAMSVGLHALASTQSAGLFQAAAMESNPLGIPYKTIDEAMTLGKTFADDLDCLGITQLRADCLRGKSVSELIGAEAEGDLTSPLIWHGPQWALAWTPALDQGSWSNPLFLGQPLHGTLGVPMLLGTNQDEGIVFVESILNAMKATTISGYVYKNIILPDLFPGSGVVAKILGNPRYQCTGDDCTLALTNVFTDYNFSCSNRYLGVKTARVSAAPSLYAYYFTQVTNFNFWPGVPACAGKVCHGDELPYVFNTPSAVCQEDAFNPSELGLAKDMSGYWASFDKSHQPYSGGGPWFAFGSLQNYMKLQVNPTNVTDPLRTVASCHSLWDGIGYEPSTAWSQALARAID